MITEFICSQCNEHKKHESEISTGYGKDKNDNKVCFACCGLNDAKSLNELLPKEKICFYYANNLICNWPNTLSIKPYHVRYGRHNIARTRQDIYFYFNGRNFHAVQYGSNSQIAHIKLLK
jgi:hypothetical protein